MRSIFQCMMEQGYGPSYEKSHILFNLEDNIGVVEYEEGILSVRVFFSIDEDAYDLFLEASNATMCGSYIVKPAILEDMKSIMFSCEVLCDSVPQLRRFLPRSIGLIKEALEIHKSEMKRLILAESLTSKALPALEDVLDTPSVGNRKVLS